MDKLIRRALLGDQEAQRECTEKGIVSPCPCCGGEADTWRSGNTAFVECSACGLTMQNIRESYVLANWNTRAAPPVGRCKDCEHYTLLSHCKIHSQEPDEYGPGAYVEMLPDDFCSYFGPKGDDNK